MIVEVTLFKDDKAKFVTMEIPDNLITADHDTQRREMIKVGGPMVEAYRELVASD